MKRKGRRSKTAENSSNGVSDRQDQNGEASEREEHDSEQEDKRRKTNKRKSASKKVEEDAEENAKEDSEEPEDKRKKPNKRKSASKKADADIEENAHERFDEPEDRRRKSNKRKSSSKKVNESTEESAHEGSEEPDDKRKKSAAKRKGASKKPEEEEEEPQYEVQQVLDEKMIQGVRHYLIRWKGYEPESDTWEPESTLNCSELISEFKAKKKKKGKSKLDKRRGRKGSTTLPDDQQTWDENQDFEVDRILDVYFKRNGQREFLVSWKGYPTSQNSWEPEENMDCKELIKKFMEKVEKAKESDQRELRIKRTHTDRLTLMSDGHRGRRLSKRNQGKQRVHYHDAE